MSMTEEEVLALPVMVDLMTAAKALGIGRTRAYELARTGNYPVRLIKIGNHRYRCRRADLLNTLGIRDVRQDEPHDVES